MSKIIFLDIDGVLNTENFICAYHYIRTGKKDPDIVIPIQDEFGDMFDPMAVRALKYIIEETGAKIVISSTWRHSGLKVMQLMWEMRDLPGEVIDVTPFLNGPRGEEIAEWLRENQTDQYVIIDDDSDMLFEQKQNFVQTNFRYGLTFDKADEVISILNKD
jgi:hypothetical protein